MTTLKLNALKETPSAEGTAQAPVRKAQKDKLGRAYGTGRRKNAIARVWIKPGSGKVSINNKTLDVYFPRGSNQQIVLQCFEGTKTLGQFDLFCTVKGGGCSGQAGAIKHGLARALDNYDPEQFHLTLRKLGFLTRDSRVVERKKFGKHKARKSTQFSKR